MKSLYQMFLETDGEIQITMKWAEIAPATLQIDVMERHGDKQLFASHQFKESQNFISDVVQEVIYNCHQKIIAKDNSNAKLRREASGSSGQDQSEV